MPLEDLLADDPLGNDEGDDEKEEKKEIVKPASKAAEKKLISNSEKIEKMKNQNAKLKKEFAELKYKLEECIEKAKRAKRPPVGRPGISEDEKGLIIYKSLLMIEMYYILSSQTIIIVAIHEKTN